MSNFQISNSEKSPSRIHGMFSGRRCALHSFFAVLFMVLLFGTTPLLAQVATGDILGTVTDGTGSVVPGATVRLENLGTHEVRTFVTKDGGEYTFSAVQPGTYSITVGSPTFKTFTTRGVVVAAADRVRIDAPLQPGSVTEQVEVTATPSSLQTDSTTVGSTITEKTLLDAPVIGRNYIALIQVQAGVNAGSANSLSSGANETDRRLSSSVSANGQQEIYNNNQVDGLDNNSRTIGAPLLRPSVEAIAETRTEINLYTAEVGRTGGAAIDVITKSGSNQFHGSAYEFFRNDITDTRNFFVPTFARKPELRQNQFGGSLGGPIFKDKTFFFVDYENLRRVDATNSVYISTVPTAYEEANPGVLADPAYPTTGINPLTGSPIAAVPTASLNPTTLAYFKLFPAPNLPGTANNFYFNPAGTLFQQLADLRIDHHFGPKDSLFGRYSYNRTSNLTPPYFPNVNGVSAGGNIQGTLPSTNLTITHNGSFGYTHIFTPSLLLELKTAYTYFNLATLPLNFGTNYNNSAPYVVPNANVCAFYCSGLMPISVNGYGALGDIIATPFLNNEHNTQFAGTVTYTHGRQTFKIGAALIRRNFSFQLPVEPKGIAIFASASPQLSLANFFRGTPYIAARQVFLIKPYDRTWEPSAFFQDDWRATDHLTFNLGLRYDVFTRANEKYGNNANFNLATLSIVKNATGGLQNSYHDVSPRIGFDATIGKGMVLRGGFGLAFYVGDSNNNLILNDSPVGLNTGNITETGLINVVGVPSIASTATAVITRPLNLSDSYLEQTNLLLQKEYRGTVFTVGYVAEMGRHVSDQVPNLNLPAPSGPSPAGTPAQPGPYASVLPGITTINQYAPFGSSSYNSMQVSLERRITHGLTANFNYTWSHNLDDVVAPFDGDGTLGNGFGLLPTKVSSYDYGNSALDLQSRFAGFFSYDLPFGNHGSKIYRNILGDFRFNGLGFWQTGSPFTVISSVPQIDLPTVTADKPNQVVAHVQQSGSLTQQFNINDFAAQPFGTAGSERRNQLFGPDLRRGDLSLFKTIPIREGVHLELRAECFNITNTPNFATPNRTISAYAGASSATGGALPSSTIGLGSITSTVYNYNGRQFQFAGRFSF
jgi:hypothetical protein